MERHVKERLVGAAVLIAAAVILIPELLSGPKQPAAAVTPRRAGEAPMKTYTIDLNRSPDSSTAADDARPPQAAAPQANVSPESTGTDAEPGAATVTEPVPPPARQQPADEPASMAGNTVTGRTPETNPESGAVNTAPRSSAPASSDRASSPSPAPATLAVARPAPVPPPAQVEVAKPAAPTAATPAPVNPLASAAANPRSAQWAVQLGSFASKANAERLVKEWAERGQQGSVSPLKVASGSTLYRVRLGPFAERAAAEETLRKVRPSISGAAVVAYP